MTYYELVNYLETLVEKPEITEDDINYINNKEISLNGSRYVRFINQINYVMSERLYKFKDNLLDKLDASYIDSDNLVLSMDPLRLEINYLNLLLTIKYIKDENKNAYISSIVEENNKLVDTIKEYFDDDERINIINSYYLEEK